MKREIKFRAYNKETGVKYSWEDILKLKNFYKLLTLSHVEMMKYTGIKDKNRTEIYEGDIIKVSFIEEGKSPVCFFYKVEYKDFGFQLHHTLVDKNWGSLSRLFELRWETEIEVIGNIHENKELI